MKVSSLELRWRIRPGGERRTERRFLDFIIDGVSLYERVRVREDITGLDEVTGLGCWAPEVEFNFVQQLLGQVAPKSPSGRVPLYVCAQCGDLGCGAVTARVERTSEGFVWRDFAYENNWDKEATDFASFQQIGPFLFNEVEYLQSLTLLPKSEQTLDGRNTSESR